MELKEIFADIEVYDCGSSGNTAVAPVAGAAGDDRLFRQEISGLAYDSRRVQPGFLFFCVPGQKTDGHRFAADAVARGAAALVVERYVDAPVPQIRVPSTRKSLALAARAFYGNPAGRMLMVGVTGTNGKTTTTHLVEAILTAQGRRVGLIGTNGNHLGEKTWPAQRTTPESLDLQALLAEMAAEGADAVIMEVSSHALDQQRVLGVDYDLALFTNLTQDHLDYHETLERYREAKGILFRGLTGAMKSIRGVAASGTASSQGDSHEAFLGGGGKGAIINADDPNAGFFMASSAAPVITYGIDADAMIKARDWSVSPQGVACEVLYPGGQIRLNLQLTGRFNLSNALAAFAAGWAAGIAPAAIASALGSVAGVAGRFERIDRGQPFSVIVDYAHTPDGLENVLVTARALAKGRVITVFGCGGDRDRTKRPKMGAVVARLSDVVVVTSDNPRTEDPCRIIEDILPGIEGTPGVTVHVEPDRSSAIAQALSLAREGDLVMIAGKGHETYQIMGAKIIPFDDRQIAHACLRGMGYDQR
ncbi:UDP-N-acetylmuramoyl-L-alanyl-D-glutamate--2,6-diaminopimelate ligase [Heliobacterium gestii]|uniref:UDP-N-acetylmuramoyl-L-alanyl-D-glutamate--2,6-diaminopimelate ligase n=1 Tax=Heliomicrobium gestii TaxID=2699 RepID=A0A845LAY9_HELGE|nr:UDP-N-acetylmuramoyl-L-alanyl-D-glutamate--2,6-diaminopimelate ligase [Heliomicrobium gestii]MBM7867515.1 UDP-N-acetylmuramoyl-L-alanyl-D-glutamate--2,6-diaminopimelate ligase [Heliomicrobium gestii]MZP43937.1 UDP-N-acetylmuramoyl-L-alanyl-D-glutamate--2,6-diaminopimelate ligase [Heliomicrobium gestii]